VRRVLLLAYAAVLVVVLTGAGCVSLTPPARDAGPKDREVDTLADGSQDSEQEAPETDGAQDGASDGPRDGGADTRSTLIDGLVGYWKLDELASVTTAADSSPVGTNNGQIMGNPTRVSTGLPPLSFSDPRAFAFAGQSVSDDGVQIPDSASLRPPEVSVAVWVKLASLQASSVCGAASRQMQYIVERRNTRGAAGMFEAVALLLQSQGTFAFLLSASDGTQHFATSSSLNLPVPGRWYHLVGTYDGTSRVRLYVDGTLEGAQAHSAPIDYDTGGPWFIGRTGECGLPNGAAWDARLNGTVDDVRIYNRELTAPEVSQLAGGAD